LVNCHFAKLETEVTISKVQLSSATKIKAMKKIEESTATPNDELYCQVCCCERSACFVEQHVTTRKHQKGIEKRNIFAWSYKVIFSEK